MKKVVLGLSLSAVVMLAFLIGIYLERHGEIAELKTITKNITSAKTPEIKYGLNLSEFVVVSQKVQKNEVFADILLKNNVAYQTVHYLMNESKSIFNYNKIQSRKSVYGFRRKNRYRFCAEENYLRRK
jgi:hypothetical protein